MSTIQTDTILLFSHVSKIYSNTALDLKASLCGLQDQCHSVDDGIWFGSWATFIDTVHTYVSRLIHHGEYLKERYDFAEIGARQLYRVRYMIEKFKDEFETGYIAQPEAVQYLLCRWRLHKIREYRTKLSVIVASALQNLKVKASIEDDRHIVAINNTLRSRLGDDERSIHRSIYEVKGQLYSIFRPPSRDEEIPKIIRKLKQVLELEIANGASGSCIHEGARYLIDLYKRSLDTQPTHTPSTWSIPEENLVSKRGVAKHVLGDETWTIMKARYFGTGVILLQKDDLSPVELNRFRVSVSKWINLRHPAIESLIGVCDDGPNVALVKSLYRQPLARTLKQYRTNLRQDRCLPLRMRWIHEVATGMAYIHKHGLVHGDLRLENIVNDRYCVQITVNSCIHRDIQGRPVQRDGVSYAPELRRRFPAEPTMATDVYAFGILMCYLIYCRPPEVLQHIEKMTQPVDGIPAEYTKLIAQCLDSDPRKRPSFDDILYILEDFETMGGLDRHSVETRNRITQSLVSTEYEFEVVDSGSIQQFEADKVSTRTETDIFADPNAEFDPFAMDDALLATILQDPIDGDDPFEFIEQIHNPLDEAVGNKHNPPSPEVQTEQPPGITLDPRKTTQQHIEAAATAIDNGGIGLYVQYVREILRSNTNPAIYHEPGWTDIYRAMQNKISTKQTSFCERLEYRFNMGWHHIIGLGCNVNATSAYGQWNHITKHCKAHIKQGRSVEIVQPYLDTVQPLRFWRLAAGHLSFPDWKNAFEEVANVRMECGADQDTSRMAKQCFLWCELASRNDKFFEFILATFYITGYGITPSIDKAIGILSSLKGGGTLSAAAAERLAYCIARSNRTYPGLETSGLLEKAVDKGNPLAMKALATILIDLYELMPETRRDRELIAKARDLLISAHNNNCPGAREKLQELVHMYGG